MVSFREKIKLLKGLCKGDIAYNGPFYAAVDITRRCNLKCIGCRTHSPEAGNLADTDLGIEDIPFPLFDRFCEELEEMGTGEIVIIGDGEPFLHQCIFDMIRVAKERGMRVKVATNGTLLDDAACREIIGAGLDILKVTLWGITPEEYKKNYPGTPFEYFERVVDNLKRLSALKDELDCAHPKVYLHRPINRYNINSVDRMVGLAIEAGCDVLSFSPLIPWRGETASSGISIEDEDALKESLGSLKKRLNTISMDHNIDHVLMRYGIGGEVWKKLPCYMGWLNCRVRVDGSVQSCKPCDVLLGNLNENSFADIWNGANYRSFRRRTLTREGLTGIANKLSDCSYCCLVGDNLRVHNLFKWFAPFFVQRTSEKSMP